MFIKYTDICNYGAKDVEDILIGNDPMFIQEKIDGSNVQITKWEGKMFLGTHNTPLNLEHPTKMFIPFVEWALKKEAQGFLSDMDNGTILYGEMATNQGKIMYKNPSPFNLFDIANITKENNTEYFGDIRNHPVTIKNDIPFINYLAIIEGKKDLDEIRKLLAGVSAYGSDEIEGIVMKIYTRRNMYNRPLFAKIVNEKFREKENKKKIKDNNDDIFNEIGERMVTEARLDKVIMALKEQDIYLQDLKDIPNILKGLNQDVLKECKKEIEEEIWNICWKKIARAVSSKGVRLFKEKLMSK